MTVARPFPPAAATTDPAPRPATACAPWIARYQRRPAGVRLRYRATKRAFDIVVSAAVLVIAAPVMAVAVVALKLESPRAPVVFAHDRTGRQGQRFRLLKLRSMIPGAEAAKASLASLNQRVWPDFKVDRDPRITRVGRVLRRTSIDELPQLINVLLGHMSLVGPRPISLEPARHEQWQLERNDVVPGLTGLWQVAGRSSPSFIERVRLDIAYAERRSLLLDVEILVRTIPVVISGHGAA